MVDTETFDLYIDGSFVEPASSEWFESTNPYTGEPWSRIPRGSSADIDAAVEAAHRAAFDGEWANLTATDRGAYLYALAEELEDFAEDHARLETQDNGKPIRETRGQHAAIPDWYRFYAGLADKIRGETIPVSDRDKHVYTRKEPVGVVGAITPWNSPLMLATWKLAPALAAGCTVVLKPDEKTSASALSFAKAIDAVGFPDGAVNVVTGYGAEVGQPLIEHDNVDKVSFTGGTKTGSHIAGGAGAALIPTTMELGGKSPNIVFADAAFDDAVSGAINGMFSASGQSCSAGSRLLLHTEIHDEFVDELVDRVDRLTLGDPMESTTEIGPLGSTEQLEKVQEYVDIGREEGATLRYGGTQPESDLASDQFFLPTVFTNVDNDSRLAQEEIFGPVLSVIKFETEEEAIEIANDVEYGLAGGVWTEDIHRAHRVAHAIRAGRIWINTYRYSDFTAPQGGYKQSGWGRENGIEAVEEYLHTKAVWIELAEETTSSVEAPDR